MTSAVLSLLSGNDDNEDRFYEIDKFMTVTRLKRVAINSVFSSFCLAVANVAVPYSMTALLDVKSNVDKNLTINGLLKVIKKLNK